MSPFDVGQRVAYLDPWGDGTWRTGRAGNYPPVLGVTVYDDESGRMQGPFAHDKVRPLTEAEITQLETYGELRLTSA